jgi:hypothetical protein
LQRKRRQKLTVIFHDLFSSKIQVPRRSTSPTGNKTLELHSLLLHYTMDKHGSSALLVTVLEKVSELKELLSTEIAQRKEDKKETAAHLCELQKTVQQLSACTKKTRNTIAPEKAQDYRLALVNVS